MKKIFMIIVFLFIALEASAYGGKVRVGVTFSRKQTEYLDIDWKDAYGEIIGLDWDIIRLGTYWDEIEKEDGKFSFEELDWMISEAGRKGMPVVLTIGIKAPRWPEFHLPEWLKEKAAVDNSNDISRNDIVTEHALRFIERVMGHYENSTYIKYVQIENEALNRFGIIKHPVREEFLKREVDIVRELDKKGRPVILTAATYPNSVLRFVSDIFAGGDHVRDNLEICDILGINVYPVIGHTVLGMGFYLSADKRERMKTFSHILEEAEKMNKQVWVTELQAEPWEPGELVHKGDRSVPSAGPEMTKVYFEELSGMGFRTIFLWGSEYWYYQKTVNDNSSWWDMAEDIIKKGKEPV